MKGTELMATEEKKPRTRAKRRNYQQELERLRIHCEVSLDVLAGLQDGSERLAGQGEAYAAILKRLTP